MSNNNPLTESISDEYGGVSGLITIEEEMENAYSHADLSVRIRLEG